MAVISVHQFAQCITCHAWSPDQSSNHSSLLNSPSFLLISFVFYFNLVWFVVFVWILKVWCTFLDVIMIGSNFLFFVLRFLFWIKWSIRFEIYSLVFAVDLCSVWIHRYLIKLLVCYNVFGKWKLWNVTCLIILKISLNGFNSFCCWSFHKLVCFIMLGEWYWLREELWRD
jgi:hypothetical protein